MRGNHVKPDHRILLGHARPRTGLCAAARIAALSLLLVCGGRARELPGFGQTGTHWHYVSDGGSTVTGILVSPSGDGPFPAIVISHGKGGTAAGFSLSKAREMVDWGMVCIGPLYTHGEPGADPSQDGARPENLRRAGLCLDILESMPQVDRTRIAAYGNSMGAFVTVALAARHPARIRRAAITAGGVVPVEGFPAPSTAEAGSVRAPFLILHGQDDQVVPPARSELLKQVLDGNSVANERRLYPGVGHDLHAAMETDVNQRIRSWFSAMDAPPFPAASPPHGIYVLDGRNGTPHATATLRDGNLRDRLFVDGYALRVAWDFVEPSPGVYDFTIIDNILAKLPAGQKLSLILVPPEPAEIAETSGVVTWMDVDRNGDPVRRAVPWDPVLRQRRGQFLAALAAHQTGGVALAANPVLAAVNPYLPGGHTGIRDPNQVRLKNLPGYSRAGLLSAVRAELHALTGLFPGSAVQLGFWKVQDDEGGTEAWEELRRSILAEFDGTSRPKVGFFMENLAASRPAPATDPLTGYPVTEFAAPLHLSMGDTWTAFQALTSWTSPFTGHDKVANATPGDGIRYALDTFGCRYFELYVSDIDNPQFQAELQLLHDQLTSATAAVGDWNSHH